MHNGWPSFTRRLLDHVQFQENLERGTDVKFCNALIDRGFETNGLSALLGYYSQEARQSPKGHFDIRNTCVHANITCPINKAAADGAAPRLSIAIAERQQGASTGTPRQNPGRNSRRPRRPAARGG